MEYIDLRSDTVTVPTPEMRKAMCEATVGDDVYGDDPTMNELEKIAAQKVGKEAALFVPSGTFGNQLALLTHTLRGDEVILDETCHIVMHEVGASAVIAGVQLRTFKSKNGVPSPDEIEKLIRENDIHYPRTGLICLESAHSLGTVIPLDVMEKVREVSLKHGIPIHLDGARVFNAATSLGIDVKEITSKVDSVMFCLSKGLCAPVGSMLAGSREFIEKARKNRKLMGGGMRQAGILAAAGIVALEKMTDRLKEDHENAKYLAELLDNEFDFIEIKKDRLEINMVFFELKKDIDHSDFVSKMFENGIKINPPEGSEYRFVTHYYINRDKIERTIEVMKKILK
ncbi:MAG: threonine aldolase [Thermotogaceae bacterium]|nr:threonine aldolase [Thermotogaceae bacterium]